MAEKRSGGYSFLNRHLVKRRDVIEAEPEREKTWFDVAEEELQQAMLKRAERDVQTNEADGTIDLHVEVIREGPLIEASENLCHVKDCKHLISDSEFSLFCADHLLQALNENWPDWFPAPGWVPPPRRRSNRPRPSSR